MEPRERVELSTCRLRIGCSTTELPRLINYLREPRTALCVVLACSKPGHSRVKLLGAHNVIALLYAQRAMSGNLHGRRLIHSCTNQVPNGGATEIVRGKALAPIPLRSCLFSNSNFNTGPKPLAPKILHLEYWAVGLEFLLQPSHKFARHGECKGVVRKIVVPHSEDFFLLGGGSSVWDCMRIRRSATMLAESVHCAWPGFKKNLALRKTALESTLPPHNDGVALRVSERIESCFRAQSEFLWADLLACPSRVQDASGPRGSRARRKTSAV